MPLELGIEGSHPVLMWGVVQRGKRPEGVRQSLQTGEQVTSHGCNKTASCKYLPGGPKPTGVGNIFAQAGQAKAHHMAVKRQRAVLWASHVSNKTSCKCAAVRRSSTTPL